MSDLIRRAIDDHWHDEVMALAGSVPDFPDASSLRAGAAADSPRSP